MVKITFDKKLKSVIKEIAEISGYLWGKGWAARNAGNISVNVTEFIPNEIQRLEHSQKIHMKNN